MAINLRAKVISDIICPAIEDGAIRKKAKTLGIDPKTPDDVKKLTNQIVADLLPKIREFLLTSEAKEIWKSAPMISAGATYSPYILDRLEVKMNALYPKCIYVPPKEQSWWTWSTSIISA